MSRPTVSVLVFFKANNDKTELNFNTIYEASVTPNSV